MYFNENEKYEEEIAEYKDMKNKGLHVNIASENVIKVENKQTSKYIIFCCF